MSIHISTKTTCPCITSDVFGRQASKSSLEGGEDPDAYDESEDPGSSTDEDDSDVEIVGQDIPHQPANPKPNDERVASANSEPAQPATCPPLQDSAEQMRSNLGQSASSLEGGECGCR